MKKLGLALGGGGAKGLAHIPMLEVFDELGVRPHRIAGTSIGSIMGTLYASGLTGRQIRDGVDRMVIHRGDSFKRALKKKEALRWFEFLDVDFGTSGLFKGNKFIEFLFEHIDADTFDELDIPLAIVASDFWTSEQVVLDSGDLRSAVKASMGLPGVFRPVRRDDCVLIDGGGVNPVPHDLLTDCDIVVAIDVLGYLGGEDEKGSLPNLARTVLGTFDVMQNSIIAAKRRLCPPDVYIRPDIIGIDILDFYKADEIYRQAEPSRRQLRRDLERVLG